MLVAVGRGVFVGFGVLVGPDVKVDITTLLAPVVFSGMGVEVVEVPIARTKPQQIRVKINTPTNRYGCFFASGFFAGFIGLLGAGKSRPQCLQTIASSWISSAQ